MLPWKTGVCYLEREECVTLEDRSVLPWKTGMCYLAREEFLDALHLQEVVLDLVLELFSLVQGVLQLLVYTLCTTQINQQKCASYTSRCTVLKVVAKNMCFWKLQIHYYKKYLKKIVAASCETE